MDTRRPIVCPVLVGRDDLLRLAERRLTEAGAGAGRLLLIAGEAGLGKTRLLDAILERAVADGFRTFRGGTYPSDLAVTGAVLMDLARILGRSPTDAAVGAALTERLDAAAVGTGDAHRRRRILVLDVADILAGLATPGPVVLALEDLHWSDDLTLEIVEALARRASELPLLIIGTYRSDELYPRVPMREWRSRLVSRRLAEEIRLTRLTPEETGLMTSFLSGTSLPAPRDVVAAVHDRSDGIPLHVEELLGGLSLVAGDAAAVAAADVPDTLESALLARLEQRTPDAAALARAGAVIGRGFDIDMLGAVVGQPPEALDEPLAELVDHFLLVQSGQTGRYGFRHALICDSIYGRIPEPQRRRLHDRTADAAATRPDVGTDAFLAHHYERAGRPGDAYRHALAAADRATALSSHSEARDLYGIAVRTAPSDLPAYERGALWEALATHAAATDANHEAVEAYEHARTAYLAGGDVTDAARVVGPLTALRHLLGDDLDRRVDRLQRALAELDDAPADHASAATRTRAGLLAELAAAYMLDRRLEPSMAVAAEAMSLAASVGDAAIEGHAATTLGACEVFAGRMDDGWARVTRVAERARSDHLEAEAARAHRMIGSCASVLVEYDLAERWLREGTTYAEGAELWNHRYYMAAHLAHVLWATGRWAEADAAARHALADGRGGITTRITALHVLGYLSVGRDDREAARAALEEARDLGRAMRELQRLSPALWGLAELAALDGDPATAIALAEEGYALSAAVGDAAYLFPFVVTGTRAYLTAGDPAGARDWLARTSRALTARSIPGTLPAIAHARGLVALADGRTGAARDDLRAAADDWRARDRAWEGTWATIDLARALQRANLRPAAREASTAAAERARAMGSPVLEGAARQVLGARPEASDAEAWAPLTAREFEVARLVADGHTNAEIADELVIAPKTVSAHVEHILAKLGMGRRTEVAAWVATLGATGAVLHSRPHGDDREE